MIPPMPPAWANAVITWLYPAALLLAIIFPFLRALLRRVCCVQPYFTKKNVMHDVSGGFVIPHFVAIAVSPMYPPLLSHIEGHAYALAGLMGAFYVIADLADHAAKD
ncbi:MAG: hypothetical protein HY018_04500 [Hydrogenophilales bacterium]|nr:hypothetical protein [Hydrogenophilales bacterium]